MIAQPTSSSSGRLSGRPVLCWTIVILFARQSRSPSSSWRRSENPQSEACGREDHRVVAFAGCGLTVDYGEHLANLIRAPQVRLGLVTDVTVWRQPVRQALRRLARAGQEGQEVREARSHGGNGLASQSPLAQQKARQVPHAEHREIVNAHLVQVTQEPADRLVLGDHGRLGVVPLATRSEVVVPERAEPGRAVVFRRDHRPVNLNRPTGQHVHRQHHRPTNRLDIPVAGRLSQRPQPHPGLVRDEVDAHPIVRRFEAAPGQEGGEPVQHGLVAPNRVLGPPGVAQHPQDALDGVVDICLSHDNHLCIR